MGFDCQVLGEGVRKSYVGAVSISTLFEFSLGVSLNSTVPSAPVFLNTVSALNNVGVIAIAETSKQDLTALPPIFFSNMLSLMRCSSIIAASWLFNGFGGRCDVMFEPRCLARDESLVLIQIHVYLSKLRNGTGPMSLKSPVVCYMLPETK